MPPATATTPVKTAPKPAPAPAAKPAAPRPAAGKKIIQLPTQPSIIPLRPQDHIMCFFGPPGAGKTTFVNKFGRVLFMSTDNGTRTQQAMRWPCFDWNDCEDVVTALEAGQAKNYDYLCIDHCLDWAFYAELWALEKLGVATLTDASYGKGWSTLKKELHRFVTRVKRLNMGLIFLAHEEVKKVKVRTVEIDRHLPLMSKQAWESIIPLVDIVGYVSVERAKDPKNPQRMTDVRTLRTQPTQELYCKDRARRARPTGTPYEILDGQAFIASFSKEKA